MTEPENNTIELSDAPQPEKPKLYSKRVIRLFSILFSTLAGGILLRQNLKDVGNVKAGNYALIFSIGYTIGIILLINYFLLKEATVASFFLNVIGSAVLNEYFYHKFIKEPDSYEKKSFWKPLIIWLIIVTVLIFLAVYGGSLNKQ
jgi:hypothetical protein